MNALFYWVRNNLAPTPLQAALSLLGCVFVVWFFKNMLDWAIIEATFVAPSISECHSQGACWAIVTQRWQQFVYGFYPLESVWRVNIGFVILAVNFLLIVFLKNRSLHKLIFAMISLIIILMLFHGGVFGLSKIQTDLWGGFFLTVFLSLAGIVGAFPIAILLALGRKSELKIVKSFCVIFIEMIRGVPLISVLFMASFMLPLFLPEGVNFDKLLRALIGIMLFQAAYLAEVVRGGMNAIGKGQYEASHSIGLSYGQMIRYIILPQALRTVIPGIVNTFIALFKDTTLVMIIGILDFLGIVQSSITDPKWIGSALEAYVFCALVYWLCCFGMSMYSKHLELKLRIKH